MLSALVWRSYRICLGIVLSLVIFVALDFGIEFVGYLLPSRWFEQGYYTMGSIGYLVTGVAALTLGGLAYAISAPVTDLPDRPSILAQVSGWILAGLLALRMQAMVLEQSATPILLWSQALVASVFATVLVLPLIAALRFHRASAVPRALSEWVAAFLVAWLSSALVLRLAFLFLSGMGSD